MPHPDGLNQNINAVLSWWNLNNIKMNGKFIIKLKFNWENGIMERTSKFNNIAIQCYSIFNYRVKRAQLDCEHFVI